LQNLNEIFSYAWNVKTVTDSLVEALPSSAIGLFKNTTTENYTNAFDYVIGNPPYISYKECTQQKLLILEFLKEKKVKLSDIYGVNLHSVPNNPKKYAPNPNLYAFFMALGLGLLKEGGKLCYIIPQTLLTASDLDVLRYHLAKYTTIEKMIVFNAKMFIERGLKQNKVVITSSLIVVLKKQVAKLDHETQIIHVKNTDKTIDEILDFVKNKDTNHCTFTNIPQNKLLKNILNWSFIKKDSIFGDFYTQYITSTNSIATYYQHTIAFAEFGTKFYFDRGLKYPKTEIKIGTQNEKGYFIAHFNKNRFGILATENFIASNLLDFPFGSQGTEVYEAKYKIAWSYMNYDIFRFSEQAIMLDYNNIVISSDNKNEMLYLFALLNSKINKFLLKELVGLENEQDILVGIKTVKDFIRVPIIIAENQAIKTKLISLSQDLLNLENVKLGDFVDFKNVMVQKFDKIEIAPQSGCRTTPKGEFYLLLTSGEQITKCKIKNNIELVTNFIEKTEWQMGEISLQILKNQIIIDEIRQAEIIEEMNKLVFCLYFNVQMADLEGNKFYQYLENAKKIKV
jgi:hypothetical protein